MCDQQTEADNRAYEHAGGEINRRDFNVLGTAGLLAMLGTYGAVYADDDLVESDVNVPMKDGVSDSYFVHPKSGSHAGVLIWPDIRGLRPAFKAMGRRMAQAGYAVLVVNPFWRDAKAPVVGPNASFRDPDTRKLLMGMARKIAWDQKASMSDARDYITFLDKQDAVDNSKQIGTAGYCMGGPLIMRTAAAVPERVGAAASFHGGGLATDKPDSPHLLIPKSPAHVLHAIAENDHERNPEARDILTKAYADAGIAAEIDVYAGTLHGWCPPDSAVYNEEQAERAWARMLTLFKKTLA